MSVFVASNGRYYTASEVVEKLEAGRWTSCLWDEDTGRELVETRRGEVLLLVPTSQADFESTFETEPAR
ncbi:hypothetical protein [Haloarchaeobius amylolyticus]|uniref:hypothetical protein n=1 Tax=Haloarchaeobius amylolyticus TaxID=1198296 RepID=UPI00226F42E4|nr:hypothetical protein [Haloarchaeobius amylolyticus]